MYPQGVCRIRKPACAGNGCAIFPTFEAARIGKKIRYPAADDLFRGSIRLLYHRKAGKAIGRNRQKEQGFLPALSVSKKPPIYVVIPNQSADWCGNPPDRSKSHWFRI